jgi:hypothetical protein
MRDSTQRTQLNDLAATACGIARRTSGLVDIEVPANLPRQEVVDFSVPRNRGDFAR